MKWCVRFFMLFVTFAIFCSLSTICFAEDLEDFSDYYSFEDVADSSFPVLGDFDPDEPLSVVVVDDETSYFVRSGRAGDAVLVIGDEPPSNPLFYGSGWVTGYDSNLGEVTIYLPIDTKSGHWGVDSNGYLYNVTSGSISGYLSGVYNNSVSASGFSYPRYRDSGSSSYSYLYLTPENSNLDIATTNVPRVTLEDVWLYILIVLVLGVFLFAV